MARHGLKSLDVDSGDVDRYLDIIDHDVDRPMPEEEQASCDAPFRDHDIAFLEHTQRVLGQLLENLSRLHDLHRLALPAAAFPWLQ